MLAAAGWTTAKEPQPLQFVESGMREIITGYRPHRLQLDAAAPAGLKKAPDGLTNPQYASFTIGRPDAPATIIVMIDMGAGEPGRVWVDGNGNGDLTDDGALEWKSATHDRPDGTKSTTHSTRAMVTIPFVGGPRQSAMRLTMIKGKLPDGVERLQLLYASDYGFRGEVRVGDRMVPVVLDDAGCTGHPGVSGQTMRDPLLWLDLDGDGKLGARGELVLAGRPFEADGKWWQVTTITADPVVTVGPGQKPAPVANPTGPDLSPGQKAPSFAGKTLDGKEVKFPDDFKGKVLLIDFWATWCGPCLAEAPNVVAAYQKYHGQGLEVLGISLDRENMADKLREVSKAKGMTWDQIYDGGGWNAAISRLYGVRAIPHMLLVDGDTGTVIRNKDIRGPELAKAIEAALAGRKKAE
jgi:thiol-disulfide isomerase/thioredoxin